MKRRMPGFDPERFFDLIKGGHTGQLAIGFHAQGPGWIDLILPYDAKLVGDAATGILASGPIVALMDMATSSAVWIRRGRFAPHVTLDLRVDYLRPATPERAVIGRGECYQLSRSVAFVRGVAYHDAPNDPIAHVAGTFMLMDAPAKDIPLQDQRT
jgi:uncharacterized protein (TIGR00369 family)